MSDTPIDATPAPATPRKRAGRPPGSKTDPAKKAAAARKRAARAPRTGSPTARTIAEAVVPPEKESAAGRPSTSDKLAKSLALNYHALGGILQSLGLVFPRLGELGREVEDSAEECGRALAAWADTNAAVKRFLTEGSSFGALAMVLAAHAPIGAALLASAAERSPRPDTGEPWPMPPAGGVDPNPLAEAIAGLNLGVDPG